MVSTPSRMSTPWGTRQGRESLGVFRSHLGKLGVQWGSWEAEARLSSIRHFALLWPQIGIYWFSGGSAHPDPIKFAPSEKLLSAWKLFTHAVFGYTFGRKLPPKTPKTSFLDAGKRDWEINGERMKGKGKQNKCQKES